MITIRKNCNSPDDCDDHSPPVPPPPENHNSISPFTLFLICTLAATFSFISYITIIKTCRSFQTRRRTRMMMMIRTHVMNTNNTNESHEPPNQDLIDDQSPVFHPIWLINTIGLDQSVIDSIKIFKYRKEDSTCDNFSDCAVCLGVFQEDGSLRLLPDCSHAFHVTCIDTWLRSHKNCPLCRAPVADNSGIHRISTDDRILVDDEESETPFDVTQNEATGVGNDQEIMDANGESSEKKSSVSGNLKRSVSMGSICFLDQESGNLVVSSKTSVVPTRSVNRRGSSLSVSIYGRGSMY